jgi:type II secretory pathway component PulF
MSAEATAPQGEIIARAQHFLHRGERISEAFLTVGMPGFVWTAVRAGELSANLPLALSRLADWLEVEQCSPSSPSRLRDYALALGRTGMMLSLGVPILSALEKAAESPDPELTEMLFAARAVVQEGVSLADALERVIPDLPPLTAEMVRDGEGEGRLDFALSVVADYLFDQAATAAPQEVSHG